MNKISRLVILILMFIPVALFSQIKLTGKIVNQKDEPLNLIELLVLTKDSIAVKSELTNINGEFLSIIEKGEYILQVRQLGEILWRQKMNLTKNLDLGILKTDVSKKQLDEVVVTSKKKLIERKVDRLVFNAEYSTLVGGDAIDALKATPGLIIQENSISIAGKSTIGVMIDDRLIQLSGEDLTNLLKNISFDNISKIEVISSPPAKYDAQGNSGLVNIVLKKAKKNYFSGNVKTSYTQAIKGTNGFGGVINYQKNKLTIISNFDFSKGIVVPIQKYNIYYPNYLWDETYNVKNSRDNISQRIVLDYKIKSNTIVGLEYNRNENLSDIKSTNESKISVKNNLDSIIKTSSLKNIHRITTSLNFHSVTKLDTLGRNLSFDFDYFNYDYSNNNNFNTNTFFSNEELKPNRSFLAYNNGIQNIKIYSSKIDFTVPLSWTKLSFGGKLSITKNDNETLFYDILSNQYKLDVNKSNHFLYNENNQALYVSASKELSKKLTIQIGLRLENTYNTSTLIEQNSVYKNNYTELFPTFYWTYNTLKEAVFSLNYSRRIERPSYNLLNPFRIYSTSTNYTVGNPYLSPYFSNNLEFSFTKGNLYNSVYFNYINKGIDQITITDNLLNYQYTIPYNFFSNMTYGLSENFTYNKITGWVSNNGLDISYSETNSILKETLPQIKMWSVYFSSFNSFNLNKLKTLKAEINFIYQSASISNSYKTTAYYKFDAGLRKELCDKRLQLAISISDIFKTSAIVFSNNVNNIIQEKFDYPDSQKIRFSVLYKFGKLIKDDKREFSNKDEERRTK
ncbi:outer membrane beta-barrel family protein [Flavobacterium sp.]|uniref:outer membrane beta-barrel family protein n=1 Tax=Flavobacterium sp. TaxID=239 RepID=UPI0025D967C8|nr:outer membrane beta-barrel family protein [Flavobacterium sp.]